MILIFCSLLLNFIVLKGWGLLCLREDAPSRSLVRTLLAGMLAGSVVSISVNFFYPIDTLVTGVFLILGVAFWIAHKSYQELRSEWPLIIFFLVCSLTLTTAPENFDTGLYHLPQLEWLKQQPTPLGLVNLHSRLAFTPIWFPLAAILRFPYFELTSSFVINALLYGVCLFQLFSWLKRGTWVLLLPMMLFLVVPEMNNLYRLSSPSTDLPVALITIMGIASYFVREEESRKSLIYFLVATLIKPLTFPFLMIHLIFYRPKFMNLGLMGLLLFLVSLRSLMLSGCVIYPIQGSCVRSFPWTPTVEKITKDAAFVTQRGRYPLNSGINSGPWVGRWVEDFIQTPTFLALLALFLMFSLIALTNRKRIESRLTTQDKVLYATIVVGFLVWFPNAPYVRMGLFYLTMLPLFPLMVLLREVSTPRYVTTGLLFSGILVFLMNHWPHFEKVTERWPVVPKQEIEENVNLSDQTIYRPRKGIKCWDLPLPCTTHFDPKVTYSKPYGRFLFIRREDL